MTWRAPAAFAGLLLLALPVLLHLLSRRPARVLAFPSLRFLAASTLTATRRTRINDWPLLLVRLVIVLLAVLALAQPSASVAAAGGGAVVLVVDSATVGVDTAWRADSSLSASVRRVVLGSLPEATERAIGWLQTQSAPRRLVVRSAFVRGVFDSSDVAAVPRDVAVSLEQRPRVLRTATPRDSILWHTALSDDDVARVLAAARRGGGVPVRVVRAARVVQADVVPAVATRTVVSTQAPPVSRRRPLSAATVAAALSVRADPTVRAVVDTRVSAGARAADSTRADSLTLSVLADERGVPLLTAHTVASATGASADSSPDVSALTWFTVRASDAKAEHTDMALALLSALTPNTAPADNAAVMDSAEVQRLVTRPAGAAIGAATASTHGYDVHDVHDVPTWARWLWLAVCGLLAVEWQMRRRLAQGAA